MTQPEPIRNLTLVVLVSAALLVLNLAFPPRWAAAVETASFRLSLSVNDDPVRFRTGSSGTGQSGFALILERGR